MSWYTPFLREEILLARDSSQLEIRILAQYSEDKLLCAQLNRDEDIHVQVGHELLGWPIEVIKREGKARVIAKGMHFGIIYGLKKEGVYERVKRRIKNASKTLIYDAYDRYFKRYKGVAAWIEYATEYTERTGLSLPTLFGQVRPIKVGETGVDEAFWGNQAVNSPIQGSAGQFPLLCLAIVKRNPNRYALLRDKLRNEIHDSLVATPRLEVVRETDAKLQYLMETHCVSKARELFNVKMLVPLKSDAKVGFRYGVMVEYDRKQSLDALLDEWCKKNAKVEQAFVENPMKFVDLQRGVVN